LSTYPNSKGVPELRHSIANWLTQRFNLQQISAEHEILPVSGTREALFSFVQALVCREDAPYVVMPNPFYQIYEGAAILAGAKPYFINCTEENDYLGDFDAVPAEVWEKTALLVCMHPGNPTGAVLSKEKFKQLIALSDQYGFVIHLMNAIQSYGLIKRQRVYSKFVLKLVVMTIKTVSFSIHCLNALTYQACAQVLSQAMQTCSSRICNTVLIMVRQCLCNIKSRRSQLGMMNNTLKKTADFIVPNLNYSNLNLDIYSHYKNLMQGFITG